MATKTIVDITVIDPGSNPDVDSDFNTEIRDEAIGHVTELYGKDNVANIITFTSLAAKSAFKTMCTIYEVPFARANKIAELVPPPIEGVDCTIDDIFNPKSDRYSEGAEFRAATSGDDWKHIIEGARNIEGRYKATGVHPCGLVISSQPLHKVIPLQVRQSDHRVITQWTYPECESIGLIKFDFLGLDTVDLIQHTVEYIMKAGKNPPNMLDLIHGDMDDKQTFAMLSRGETTGIFQLGSPLVKDYLKVMKPEKFDDIAAATALLRPGPMGMLSHVRYANRKNGREEAESLHSDFTGSPLDQILAPTHNLLVFQEQVLQISNQIAGFTLQEGDDLRSAMGKKKMKIMLAMKPKFFEGAKKNGYSEEAITILWDTIELFAKYAFNKSHSVAYAMAAYQAAYLKTHYPVEFMAALISQNVGVKEKILMFLQEARKMGLRVGSVDINLSDVKVAPDYTQSSGFDIVYGLSGINAVSRDMARIIVKEREENGPYTSIQDVVNRCTKLGVTNRKIYENLAKAGAFDCFEVTRRAVVENLPAIIEEAKTKKERGASLFDVFATEEASNSELDLNSIPEYSFVTKLQQEANVIGLYLTQHPLANIGTGLSQGGVMSIKDLMKSSTTTTATIVGSITDIESKIRKQGGKSMTVTIDDGTTYISANLTRDIVKGIGKSEARTRIKTAYAEGRDVSSDNVAVATDVSLREVPPVEKNAVYIMNVTYRPAFGDGQYGARVNTIKPLELSHGGVLPVRVRVKTNSTASDEALKKKLLTYAEQVSKKYPGEYPLFISIVRGSDLNTPVDDSEYYKMLAEEVWAAKTVTEEETTEEVIAESSALFDSSEDKSAKKPAKPKKKLRELPEMNLDSVKRRLVTEEELSDNVTYFDTGYTVAKNSKLEVFLSDKFGGERVDFGVFNTIMDQDES